MTFYPHAIVVIRLIDNLGNVVRLNISWADSGGGPACVTVLPSPNEKNCMANLASLVKLLIKLLTD